MRSNLVIICLLALCGTVRAQTTGDGKDTSNNLHFHGGPGSVYLVQKKEGELEKISGVNIEFKGTSVGVAMLAVMRGFVDGVIGGADVTKMLEEAQKAGGAKEDPSKFDSVEIEHDELAIGLHPDNPIKTLTKAQITDLVAGKIKNWSEVGGDKTPVVITVNKSLVATHRLAVANYGDPMQNKETQTVADTTGQINHLKANRGVMTFLSTSTLGDKFQPKLILTGYTYPINLVAKKPLKPALVKIFEHYRKIAATKN